MAANLLKTVPGLVVWNRSRAAIDRLTGLGAIAAPTAREALRGASVCLLMLANEAIWPRR